MPMAPDDEHCGLHAGHGRHVSQGSPFAPVLGNIANQLHIATHPALVIASVFAKQPSRSKVAVLGCFAASLLAMTIKNVATSN